MDPDGAPSSTPDMTAPRQQLHQQSGAHAPLDTLQFPFASRAGSELPAAETPIAPKQWPSAARKVRSVVRLEDIIDELHVAVRLREAPLLRGQKLQSSWD